VNPPRVLLALYIAVIVELVVFVGSSFGLLVLLRARHTRIWHSLGSPWIGYMQSFYSTQPLPLVTYVRRRGYLDLDDTLTRSVGSLVNLQLRFGAWVLLALCAAAAWVLFRWPWPNAT